MSKTLTHVAGATGKIIPIRGITISTGLPYTAGTSAMANLVVTATRDGGTASPITKTSATAGTYTSSGFVHRVDGVYEIGARTTDLQAGADGCEFSIVDTNNLVLFETVRVELSGGDPHSTTIPDVNVTKVGGTTQTARDLGASVLISSGTGAGQLDVTSGVISANATKVGGQTASAAGTVTFPGTIASTTNITAASGVTLSAAGVQAIWDALTAALTTVGSIGKWIVDKLDVVVSTRGTSTYAGGAVASVTGNVGGNVVGSVASVTGSVGSVTGAVGSVTGNVGGNVVGSVASVTAGVTVSTNNDKTGYSLTTAPLDAAATRAALGLASANLDTQLGTIDDFLDTEIAAIKAKTDNLPADPADASDILAATTAIAGYVDTEVAAIKTVTDHLATALELDGAVYRFTTNALEQAPVGSGGSGPTAAAIRAEIDANSTQLAAIRAKTDNLPSDPADASDIAAALATIAGYLDTEVAAIKAKTDNLPSDPADASDIATSFSGIATTLSSVTSALATLAGYVDTEVAAIKAKTDNLPSDPADASDVATLIAGVPAAVLAAASAAPIAADIKKIRSVTLGTGDGTTTGFAP